MITVDIGKLNTLEQKIHQTVLQASETDKKLTINKVAALSGCSNAKISKCIQKLGFQNFKQYLSYVYGNDIPQNPSSSELERIKHFIDHFSMETVDAFVGLIHKYNKIILFGYGPSFICVQYFEYKLRIVTNNIVIAAPDETSAMNQLDQTSLLVIFSTTGQFRSFKPLYDHAKLKGSEVLLVVEEYNTTLLADCEKIMYLTDSFQDHSLNPYDKSRSIFFIFIEEIYRRLLSEPDP